MGGEPINECIFNNLPTLVDEYCHRIEIVWTQFAILKIIKSDSFCFPPESLVFTTLVSR